MGLLLRRDHDLDFLGNRVRQLPLECQNIAQITLVALGPQVAVGRGFDQLYCSWASILAT